VRAGDEWRSRGGSCLSRVCSVETRTGIFEGRHFRSQRWRGRRLKHGGPETEENAPSSPRWRSGRDPSGSGALRARPLLAALLAVLGGRGGRRCGDVEGCVHCRTERRPGSRSASGWSLPRAEGDRRGSSSGRDAAARTGAHLSRSQPFRLDTPASPPRTSLRAMAG
jgi:hypothetical protein